MVTPAESPADASGSHANMRRRETQQRPKCNNAAVTTPECFCDDKKPGVYANPFGTNATYIFCDGRSSTTWECEKGLQFSSAKQACDLPPAAPWARTCKGRQDGFYFLGDSSTAANAYKCEGGKVLTKWCPQGEVLNTSTNECDLPGPLIKEPPLCTDAACFCNSKTDGKYTNVVNRTETSYIECSGGTGLVVACPKNKIWNEATQKCANNRRKDDDKSPVKVDAEGCTSSDCFCVGKTNGGSALLMFQLTCFGLEGLHYMDSTLHGAYQHT